jgi:hypothetical protein
VQERQRWGAQVKGAPQRVDVGWRARSTPPPPGRDVVRSWVRGQGSLSGRRSLRAQMIAQAALERVAGGRGAGNCAEERSTRRNQGWSDAIAARAAARKWRKVWECGCRDATPKGVQSSGDERGHMHVHSAALDTQTRALQERHTHGGSSQVRRGGRGHRKPGDMRKEGVYQSATEGECGSGRPASASRQPGAQAGPRPPYHTPEPAGGLNG